ncbi:MAG TPA: hypothetical protein VGG33_23435 [Polyangia bacterium]
MTSQVDWRFGGWFVVIAALTTLSATARAQPSGVKLDLYDGTVLGSPRIVGMGGSMTAAAEDMTGAVASPAVMGFRPPGSDPSSWDWDIYLDAFRATRNTDLTNSGLLPDDGMAVEASSGGLALYFGRWGIALASTGVTYALPGPASDMGVQPTVELSRQSTQLSLGRGWLDGRLGVGVALVVDEFAVSERSDEDASSNLIDLMRLAFATGVAYRPREAPLRIGISTRLPAVAGAAKNDCDASPTACRGFAPPAGITAPWQVSVGIAWRLGGLTPWNAPAGPTPFRDERSLILAADVAVVGGVPEGSSVAGFAAQMPLPSGRALNLLARLGAECEALPGRLRLRAGTYWEPARVAGRGGRVHGTAGLELHLFRFNFRARERRVRIAFAIDAARRYQNSGLSLGLWH